MSQTLLQAQHHIFHYQNFRINKIQPLGHGSYGAVYKAKCDQLPCAAKVLHPTILDPRDPGAGKIMERFQQECSFLENIRHPHIVQYLGMIVDSESKLPVLLMELLDESLTKMLEHSKMSLPYYVQVDICHDIALAVAYLHSNDIIHRDLSSNNVLIIAGRRAKVTDFGMSKLASWNSFKYDPSHHVSRNTGLHASRSTKRPTNLYKKAGLLLRGCDHDTSVHSIVA